MQELKSCPFCGSDDIYIKHNGARYGQFYYAECTVCGGRTRGICRPYKDIPEDDPEEWDCRQAETVVMLWNRRAPYAEPNS